MIRVLALVLAYCCYCSYSLADGGYTQQYQVGDSGPNSGTITAVTVNSTLTDTQIELIGGFQETTETWNHIETLTEYRQDTVITTEIVEVITNVTREVVTEVQTPVTTTTTTETYTETTTSNLAPDISTNNYSKSGRVNLGPGTTIHCSYSGSLQAGEACFGHANNSGQVNGGGTITSNKFDIDTGLTQAELNRGLDLDYGVTVQSHQSNSQVPLCSATNGDCKDEFKLTVNIYDSTTLINSYVHSTTLDWTGSRDLTYKNSIGANNYSLGLEAELVMWGVDAGYTSRYFGPIVSDPWLTVTYDIIGYVTETITSYVTEQVISYVTDQVITYEEVTNIELVDRTFTTELTDTTTVFTSEYIGDPIADIPVEEVDVGEEFTVEIEDVNGDVIAEFTVEVVEVEAGVVEVQIESTDSATGMVEIETVAVVETIQEIETLDTGMDTSMDTSSTSSVADMDISVDSVDSIGDLAEVADIEIDMDMGSTDTTVEVEVEVEVEVAEVEVEVAEVETSIDSTSEVNTSTSIEDTNSNEASESGETSGTTEATEEGTGDTETDTSSESTGDAGSDESTSESGDSGDEGQESEDVQDSDSGDESNDENTSEEVSESSSDVEESVEGSGDSDSKEGQDGDGDKKDSNKSGSGSKTKVKTKITKSPKEIKKATKAAITKKILQQISIAANQSFAAGENLRLVLLATQGDTQTFKEYQTKLPQKSTEWYDDQGIYNNMPQVPDPYGVLFSLAQDGKHKEMVEEQYRD